MNKNGKVRSNDLLGKYRVTVFEGHEIVSTGHLEFTCIETGQSRLSGHMNLTDAHQGYALSGNAAFGEFDTIGRFDKQSGTIDISLRGQSGFRGVIHSGNHHEDYLVITGGWSSGGIAGIEFGGLMEFVRLVDN